MFIFIIFSLPTSIFGYEEVNNCINKWFAESIMLKSNHLRKMRSAECADKHEKCKENTEHCSHPNYREICPDSCGACKDKPASKLFRIVKTFKLPKFCFE
jgi:hypothetical protein